MSWIELIWQQLSRRAFNRWAVAGYAEAAEAKLVQRGYSYEELAELVWEGLGWPSSGVILELGTGPGTLGRWLPKPPGVELVGVDIAPEMLARTPPGVYACVFEAAAESVPLPSGSVHGVLSAFMLHSVPDRDRVLLEINRLLKPGSRGVIVDLFPPRPAGPMLGRIAAFFHGLWYEHAPSTYVTVDRLHEELREAGFEVLSTVQIGTPKAYRHAAVTFRRSPAMIHRGTEDGHAI